MLDLLIKARDESIPLLDDPDAWESLHIDYLPPLVERLWRPWSHDGKDYRLNLHCIYPCEEPFFHPHPWPSAITTVRGWQEMAVGYGAGTTPPPIAATLRMGPGSAYEMLDFDGWHYVKVVSRVPMLSLMLTGAPWNRAMPATPKSQLRPLDDLRKAELLGEFKDLLVIRDLMGS